MFILKIFIKIMKPIVDISPLSTLFEVFELGMNVLFELT